MTARDEEVAAHERLRVAIREAAVALYRRQVEEGEQDEDLEVLGQLEAILVDYVVVAAFDDLTDGSTSTAILRTDGKCATYRTLGLLELAAKDTG